MIDRRSLIAGGGLAVLGMPGMLRGQVARFAAPPPVVPILARRDRMHRVTVCLRPFRGAGPRIEAERIAGKMVVHHYGHGGSGWSLSWGSAQKAVPLALATGAREIAVIGAGCIGLTTAITAQHMGAKVTIYARERFPVVRSAYATGSWTPSSRIGFEGETSEGFGDWWEDVARRSFAMHQSYLGVAGAPVEWTDRFTLRDPVPAVSAGPEPVASARPVVDARPVFHELDGRIGDLSPRYRPLDESEHPFAFGDVRKGSQMTFNVAQYSRMLEAEFERAGGRFVAADFKGVRDLRSIGEKTVINCTGYAARALFRDESVVPVRGQIAWLLPQPGVTYGIYYNHLYVLARRDGIVVQPLGSDGDWFGYGDDNETPDMAAAVQAIDETAYMFRARPG